MFFIRATTIRATRPATLRRSSAVSATAARPMKCTISRNHPDGLVCGMFTSGGELLPLLYCEEVMKYRLAISAILLTASLPMLGQMASAHASSGTAKPASLFAAQAPVASGKPVARVNGTVLTDRDLLREMYTIFPYARAAQRQLSPGTGTANPAGRAEDDRLRRAGVPGRAKRRH